jgi:hypothetical protein
LASDFDALITDAEREPFSGWDFSYITATNGIGWSLFHGIIVQSYLSE